MPSIRADSSPYGYLFDGAPITHDFRAAQQLSSLPNKRRSSTGKCTCRTCDADEARARNQAKAAVRAEAMFSGRELVMEQPELIDAHVQRESKTSSVLVKSAEACEEEELQRMGLVYADERDRGEGLTLDRITHPDQEFSVTYKPLRSSRRRRRTAVLASPALSYVDISSDEELAAFLAVYDFVDVGGTNSSGEDMFELV